MGVVQLGVVQLGSVQMGVDRQRGVKPQLLFETDKHLSFKNKEVVADAMLKWCTFCGKYYHFEKKYLSCEFSDVYLIVDIAFAEGQSMAGFLI